MKTDPAQRQDEQKQPFFGSGKKSFPIQAKLSVNTPGDAHEKEADAVADKVMRMPQTGDTPLSADKEEGVQRMPANEREEDRMQTGATDPAPLMRKAAMQEEDHMLTGERDAAPQHRPAMGMDEEDNMRDGGTDLAPLQRKEQAATGAAGGDVSASFQQGLESSKGGGNPLPADVKQQMEAGIGADFSNVRIHTGGHAAQLSSSIQAQAFTHGNDIYFNEGKYSPGSSSGKHLLAHELAHTVQQRAAPAIQRSFKPEDAAQEMVGRKFTINTQIYLGKTPIPAGTPIVISTWANDSHTVSGYIMLGGKATKIGVDKRHLDTVANSVKGISQYKAGVKDVESTIGTNAKKLADYERQREIYEKASKTDKTAMPRYNKELKRQKDAQEKRYTDLNQKLIQETMYNAFDSQIKTWVDYYHSNIGAAKKWTKVDYNLVKSMIFQESSMGTAGTYLYPNPRFEGDPMTRYNLTQSIDSSGSILTLMMTEMDPALAKRYAIGEVTKDLYKAQQRFNVLKDKKRNTTEETEFSGLKKRCNYDETNKKAYWDYYYWSDSRFFNAWKEFNSQPVKNKTGKMRNLDYEFWIRTGVRWLYEKRDNVSSWEEAVRAFNGSGTKAVAYKNEVTGRRDAAVKGNNAYIPTH